MINRILLVVAFVIFFSYGAHSGPDEKLKKIRFVPLGKLMEKNEEVRKAKEKFKLFLKGKERYLKRRVEQFQKTQEKLGDKNLTEGARKVLIEQAKRQQEQILKYQNQLKEEIEKQRMEDFGPIEKKMRDAAAKLDAQVVIGIDANGTLRLLHQDKDLERDTLGRMERLLGTK